MFAGLAVVLFAASSLAVEFMSRSNAGATAFNIGIVPLVLALISIAIGWIAVAALKDRSAVLLAVAISMSAVVAFVTVFEVLETVL